MTDKRVTAILFDLDGTLIDTNELIIASYLHTLDHYCPGQFKREDVLPFIYRLCMKRFQALMLKSAMR